MKKKRKQEKDDDNGDDDVNDEGYCSLVLDNGSKKALINDVNSVSINF